MGTQVSLIWYPWDLVLGLVVESNMGYFDVDPFDPVVEGKTEERIKEDVLEAVPKVIGSGLVIDENNMKRKKLKRAQKALNDPNWAGSGIKLRNRRALQVMFNETDEIKELIPELKGNKSLNIASKISKKNQEMLESRQMAKKKKKESQRWKSSKGGVKSHSVKKASLKSDSKLISKVFGQL